MNWGDVMIKIIAFIMPALHSGDSVFNIISAASYDNIIDFLSTIGIIDDNVQKDSVITRAQFVVYMNRVMNINVTSSKLDSPIFTDVSIEHSGIQ